MLLLVGLAVLGLGVLTVAADHLILGAGRIATRLRISPVVVGVIIIGFGTSAPELLVSGLAAVQGNVALGVGNLVGSNILNLTLVLGIAGLIAPVLVRSSVLRREAPLSVAAVAVFGVLLLAGGLSFLDGIILLALLTAAFVALLRMARPKADNVLSEELTEYLDEPSQHSLPYEAARTGLGLAGTLVGAQLLVSNAGELAARLGVSQALIGLTLTAFGTSLPELVTAIQAQRRREGDLLVGNLLGSNLLNSLAGGAVIGLGSAGRASSAGIGTALIVVMVAVSVLAWILLARNARLNRVESSILLAAYALTTPLLPR